MAAAEGDAKERICVAPEPSTAPGGPARQEVLAIKWTLEKFADIVPGTEVKNEKALDSGFGVFELELNWTRRGRCDIAILYVHVINMDKSLRYTVKVNGETLHKNMRDEQVALELDAVDKIKEDMKKASKGDLDIEIRVTAVPAAADSKLVANLEHVLSKFSIN